MNLSVSGIAAGLLFGTVGLYYLRIGKREAIVACSVIGVAMMAYPYFIENEVLLWGVGCALWFMAYRQGNS